MVTNGKVRCHSSFKCLNMFFLDVAMGCIGSSVDESNCPQIRGLEFESQKPCKDQIHILSFCNLGSKGRWEVEAGDSMEACGPATKREVYIKQTRWKARTETEVTRYVLHSWTHMHTPEHTATHTCTHTCMGVVALL